VTHISTYESKFLGDLIAGEQPIGGSDQKANASHQPMKRWGFANFNRPAWAWEITESGREAYRTGVRKKRAVLAASDRETPA
jgi:hypothetical protein